MTAARNALRPGGLARLNAAYIRVSSDSQDYGSQRHAIEQAAKNRGTAIHRWYADSATGAQIDRPRLRALRRAVCAGDVAQLWVWRLDRLTRSGIVDTIQALQELRAHECQCVSVCDALPEGPLLELYVSMLATSAQLELVKIRENIAAGRERARAAGRPWGRPRIDRALRARVHELRAAGASERQIARTLQKSKTWVHSVLCEFGAQAAASFVRFQSVPQGGRKV